MAITPPVAGQPNWNVPLNAALTSLDTLVSSVDLRLAVVEGRRVTVPTNATSTGVAGSYAYNTSYLYICVATNTWKRVAITAW
jgi:hypothetical protein